MSITQVTNHQDQAVELLLEQFKGKLAIEDLVKSLTVSFNQIEQDLIDMLTRRISRTLAEGEQLTLLARLLNVPRAGRSDADLRTAITTEIKLFKSTGTRDNIIDACGNAIQITEYLTQPFGEFDARTSPTAIATSLGEDFNRRINRARSAGVYYVYQWRDSSIPTINRFAFDTSGRTFDGDDSFAIHTRSAANY
jgi:hypothetical protein